MSLIDDLRAELGIDELHEKMDRLLLSVDQIERTKAFYTVPQAAKVLGTRTSEIDAMLADGRLWTVQGLGSTVRKIPQAALDSLQQRPDLKAVAS